MSIHFVFKKTPDPPQWVSYTDNTRWSSTMGTWVSARWESQGNEILISPRPSWAVGYRPTKVRVTFTVYVEGDWVSGPQNISVRNSAGDVVFGVSGKGGAYSGDEIDLVCTDDIGRFYLNWGESRVTNIEFFEAAPLPVSTTRIVGWFEQTEGGYPDVYRIRVLVNDQQLYTVTDNLTSTVGELVTVLQEPADCEEASYHKTGCDFTFTAPAGYPLQVQYKETIAGAWNDYDNSAIPATVPASDSILALPCELF